MAELRITILGKPEAEAALRQLHAGIDALDGLTVRVGTAVVYAWGIEFGRRRDGRLARRAGGAFMLTRALQQVKPEITPVLAKALPAGAAATERALLGIGFRAEALAKAATPVQTGNLRRSLHTVKGPRDAR